MWILCCEFGLLSSCVTLFDWLLFLREQIKASLHGAQSQNQSASNASRSDYDLEPISEGPSSWPSTYPTDIQSGQAQLLKQHMLNFYSHPGTKPWTSSLQRSSNLPTYLLNTSESRLHSYNSYTNHNQPHDPVPISWPRSITATALPYIPDDHRTSHTTNALRRTSFSNSNTRGGYDDPIDESTLKYPYLHFDNDQNRYSIPHLSPVFNSIKCLLVSHS